MSFEAPIWLSLTPLLLLLFGALLVHGFRRREALLGRFVASRLLDQLTEQASRPRTWIKAGCVLLAVAAIGLALARPQYGVEWSERKARGLDIVFVLDSSKSMLATDLRPTRLDRAKLAIIDLVERLESDRIGLVAFAGRAFLQTPPTLDYAAFLESLDAVDPGIMTSGGSDLGNALNEAAEAFPSENNVKVVVLLTDGEDLGGKAIEAARSARESGIQVFAIGIGTPEGEYLKIQNARGIEEFVRDSGGKPVRSQLDEPTLQQIAQVTGGGYSRLSSESLDQLYNNVIKTLPREERESEMQEIRIERFQWALSAAAVFLVLETLIRRRRSAAIQAGLLAVLSLGLGSNYAEAQDSVPDQALEGRPQADKMPSGDRPRSEDARSLYNSAYESLTAGDYAAAAQLYESALSKTTDLRLQRDALYNMGHATYRQGRATYEGGDPQTALEQMKKAEALFQSAREIDPADASIQEDAGQVAKVRETIEQWLEQQQLEQQQESQNSENSEDSEDSEQNQDPSQNSQQQQEQDSQDSQSGEQGEDSQQEPNSRQGQQGERGEDSKQSPQDSQGEPDKGGEPNASDSPQGDDAQNPAEPQGREQPQEGEPEDGEPSSGAPRESTEDPVDDIPQPRAGEESEDGGEESESTGVPEPTEGEAGQEGRTATGSMSGESTEGMTEAEAAALLDSLRSKETLLPFIDQPRGGRQREIRDW